jgi:hypothetical protein
MDNTDIDINKQLETGWTLYLHLPGDNDWTTSSYKIIKTTNTLKQLFNIFNSIPDTFSKYGILFFMRENIKPIWEDPHNRNGGCISFKIEHDNIHDIFKQLCYSVATNTFFEEDEFMTYVNGVTISPKRNFYIIKLWLNNKKNKYIKNLESLTCSIKELNFFDAIFKEHEPEF